MNDMNSAAGPESFFDAYKRVASKPAVKAVMIASVLATAGWAAYVWKTELAPAKAAAETRFRSHNALMRLYALQLAHHKQKGTFAGDLDTLLAGAPDAEQIRAELTATTDITTLAVIGDEQKFRLEANVLDAERTLVKFRGTAGDP